jgi:hypothetical protein
LRLGPAGTGIEKRPFASVTALASGSRHRARAARLRRRRQRLVRQHRAAGRRQAPGQRGGNDRRQCDILAHSG